MMRRILMLAALFVLVACGGSDASTSPTTISFAGAWNLKTLNGGKLPYVWAQSGGNALTVMADVLTIADGGTWSETTTFQTTQNGQTTTQTTPDGGSWVRSGSSLVLHSTVGSSGYAGTFSSAELDLTDGSNAFVFVR